MDMPLRAIWYDGRVSQPRPVLLLLKKGEGGPRLVLHPIAQGADALEFTAQQVGWPERWSAGRMPKRVVIDLRDQGSVEVDDASAWQDAVAAAGVRTSLAERMQTRWQVFIGVALLAVGILLAFYHWGTPWAATQLTRQVPLAWETELAQRAMHDLDDGLLRPSKLTADHQTALRNRFDALAGQVDPALGRYPGYTPALSLSFRSGLGANAFALPGGAIVMTDALVEAAAKQGASDDALVGVLAHEIGHVVHRHTTRLMVEQAVLNVGLGLALGDVSHMLSIGSSVLTGLAYRRGHEAEADCFAARLLHKAQLPAAPMAELLLALESGRRTTGAGGDTPQAEPAGGGGSGVGNLFSSHPDIGERARKLKAGQATGC